MLGFFDWDFRRAMPGQIFLYLIFLAGGAWSQCGRQDYQYCVKLADPLLKDPHLIYPDNARDVEHVCRTWGIFVDCVKQYTDRCFTEAKRMEFNKAVEVPVNSIHRLCSMPEYRIDYMKHASCMKMTLTQDDYCGRHYKLLVGQVSGEAAPTSICCSHHLFRECVLDQTRNSCEADAEMFSAQVLDKALSFLKNQCAHYVPDRIECPGSEFYRTATSRADTSTTVTSHQMIVHLQQPPAKPMHDPVDNRPTPSHSSSTNNHNHWNPPSVPSRGSSAWTKHEWVTSWMPDDRAKTTEASGEATHSLGTVSAPPTGERTTFGRTDWDGKEGLGSDRGPGSQSKEPMGSDGKVMNSQNSNSKDDRPNSTGTISPTDRRPYTPHTWYPSSKGNDYKETNAIDEPNQQGLGSRIPENSVSNPVPHTFVLYISILLFFVLR